MMKVLLLIRALFLIPFIVIHTAICSMIVILLLICRLPKQAVDFVIGTIWSGPIVWCSGIRLQIKGQEHVPLKKGFLYLFTHSSHLDIPIMLYGTPKSFRFGAKISLFKIPIFGHAIRLSGTLPITRDDRKKVIEVYRQAEQRVAQGEAFALSPEGGRRRGDGILDFKSGPFIFAINAKMPIVPVILCGVDRCLKKGSLLINTDQLTRQVGMHFLPVIDVESRSIEDVKEFKNEVREIFLKEFSEMQKLYL